LKFIGRVQSVREIFSTNEFGVKTLRYVVTLKSFSEFQGQFYSNPLLTQSGSVFGRQLDLLIGMTNEWQSWIKSVGVKGIPIEEIARFLVSTVLGSGPTDTGKKSAGAVKSPNGAFLIPKAIAALLGLPSQGLLKYSDVLHGIFGIQKYPENKYMPVGQSSLQKIGNRMYSTGIALAGRVWGAPDMFNNATVWSLLATHLNPSINEMYCTLRANEEGFIYPYLIMRQIPFTTRFFNGTSIANTRFSSLPRWRIANELLMGYNIGPNDSTRFNFIQAYAKVYQAKDQRWAMYQQIADGNTALDPLDISRNGLRPLIVTSTADVIDDQSGNDAATNTDKTAKKTVTSINKWTNLIADFNMNGALKFTGSVTVAGVVEPICVGDNLQLEDKVFHIESVSHEYMVDGAYGSKIFRTTIGLTNGMMEDGRFIASDISGDQSVGEPVMRQNDRRENLPGYTDTEVYIDDVPIISQADKGEIVGVSDKTNPLNAKNSSTKKEQAKKKTSPKVRAKEIKKKVKAVKKRPSASSSN
jgi:hypothetical protein